MICESCGREYYESCVDRPARRYCWRCPPPVKSWSIEDQQEQEREQMRHTQEDREVGLWRHGLRQGRPV